MSSPAMEASVSMFKKQPTILKDITSQSNLVTIFEGWGSKDIKVKEDAVVGVGFFGRRPGKVLLTNLMKIGKLAIWSKRGGVEPSTSLDATS